MSNSIQLYSITFNRKRSTLDERKKEKNPKRIEWKESESSLFWWNEICMLCAVTASKVESFPAICWLTQLMILCVCFFDFNGLPSFIRKSILWMRLPTSGLTIVYISKRISIMFVRSNFISVACAVHSTFSRNYSRYFVRV